MRYAPHFYFNFAVNSLALAWRLNVAWWGLLRRTQFRPGDTVQFTLKLEVTWEKSQGGGRAMKIDHSVVPA